MSTTIRFLQQENTRLQAENNALKDENVRLQNYMAALDELHWATQEISTEENLLDLLDKILHNAMTVLQAEAGSLMLLDEEANELEFVLVHSDIQQGLRNYRIPANQGIAGWVATHKESLIVNNPQQDWRFFQQIDTEFNFDTRSLICVPLVTRDRLMGVIELLNKSNNEPFAEADMTLLSILGQIAAHALEKMERRLLAEEEQATV